MATAADQYAARHNPFVYFHSMIDGETCPAQRGRPEPTSPGPEESRDLARIRLHHARPLLRRPRRNLRRRQLAGRLRRDQRLPRRMGAEDQGLGRLPRPRRDHGHLRRVRDRRRILLQRADRPEHAATTAARMPGNGGGRVGAVLESPCIKPGTVSEDSYNHFSALRWMEDNCGLEHLADASDRRPAAVRHRRLHQPRMLQRVYQRAPAAGEGAAAVAGPVAAPTGRCPSPT